MMDLVAVKQRFGIIGTSEAMDRALEIALRVAPTDLSVLVTGESGVGKEFFPQVIHAFSARKHNKYIAVNCGAIPEGTIDSELFGHEKGAFTGATEARKGYFEEADGGTIFLDEVAELPHSTQVRLLRVLQTGEFIRVGSSKIQKTNVRVVAATNVNLQLAIREGRFREDLYYRLNTVPIYVPALRERKEDIYTLFRKFASDVAIQYRMPPISLDAEARTMLENYYWRGNIRQLKNVAEQISAIEESRVITPAILRRYLPEDGNQSSVPVPVAAASQNASNGDFERELIYKMMFDMRAEMADIKHLRRSGMPRARRWPIRPARSPRRRRYARPSSRRCAATTAAARKRPRTCSSPNGPSIVKSRNWVSMNIRVKYLIGAVAVAALCLFVGCKVSYSLSGASIPANAQTVSIAYFPNNATLVAPSLSSTLTQGLQDRFISQTRLALVPENGDLAFEGAITNYVVSPTSVQSDELAAQNRLTVTVQVSFTNRIDPTFNFTDKSFSAFLEYDATMDLSSAEAALIPELVDMLVEDIFNAAVSNW